MSGQHRVWQEQPPKRKRFTWLFWVAFGVIVIITLLLGLFIFWIIKTQDFTKASSIIGLIAGIVAILSSPLILLFTISKWPERPPIVPPHFSPIASSQTASISPVIQATASLPSQPIAEYSHSPAVWNIPYRQNRFFTGREHLLTLLHEQLTKSNASALTQPQAISGLGGIGKTQLAVEYAYRYASDYQYILWANAASRDILLLDVVALAGVLNLPEQHAQEQEIVVAAIKQWLATHNKWLLILDNADELEVVNDFLPARAPGHILITTRAQSTGTIAENIEVQEMKKEEGMLLLLRRAKLLVPDASLVHVSEEDQSTAQAIVTALAGLPLALDQAGAYIEETKCTLASYLEQYQYQRRQLYLLKRRGSSGREHPEPVATTWSLSFDRVEHLSTAAADLLRVCAFLSPEDIPVELISAGASHLGPALQPLTTDAFLLDEPIAILLHYSLVHRNTQENTLAIHPLVQAIIKASLNHDTEHEWAQRTVLAVNEAFPAVEKDTWAQCKRYLPQAQACADLIHHYALTIPEAACLLNGAAFYLHTHAFYQQAEPLYQQALAIREKVLGPEHPDTATSLDNLAVLYSVQGRYEQAEPLYQRALAITENVLGPEHPDTAICLNNLAELYSKQGRYAQAEPLYQRALAIRENVLGPEHPNTATSLNNLAVLYVEQGKYAQAEPLYQRALAITENVLGAEHPDTVRSLDNLAGLYDTQGKYEQAESLYQRALAIIEKVLGAEHPHTAGCLNNLALLYWNQGKYAQAEPLYQRALAIIEKVLGAEHPNTVIVRNNYRELRRKGQRRRNADTKIDTKAATYR